MRELEMMLNQLVAARASQYKDSEYKKVLNEFKSRINEIRMGKKDSLKHNWASLGKRG